jgi:carboxylesterase type B
MVNSLGDKKAGRILDAYDITDDDNEEIYLRILHFGNDICFLAPVLVYAHGWDGNAFVYFFNEPNTWKGPWEGHVSHVLDVAYLFQNYNEHLGEEQRATAEAFGKDLIAFASGRAPWPVFDFANNEMNVKVFGPGRGGESLGDGRVQALAGPNHRAGRRQTIFELSRLIPLTELSEAWAAFQSGK